MEVCANTRDLKKIYTLILEEERVGFFITQRFIKDVTGLSYEKIRDGLIFLESINLIICVKPNSRRGRTYFSKTRLNDLGKKVKK